MVLALVQQQLPSFFLQTPAIAAGIAGGASAGLADFGAAGAARMKGKSAPSSNPAAIPAPASMGGSIRHVGSGSTTGGSVRALSAPALSSSVPARR